MRKIENINLSEKRMIVFDLDGTLAVSKSDVDEEMSTLLLGLMRHFMVCVISGGAYKQFEKQFLGSLIKHSDSENELENLILCPTSGAQVLRMVNGKWEKVFSAEFSADEKKKIFDSFEIALKEFGFDFSQKTYGERLEDRETQITFSALGQLAPPEEKLKWDPTREKKRKIAEILSNLIPEFEVKTGGSTSVDVTKKGIDKGFGVKKVSEITRIGLNEILFIGDMLEPGCNDYPVKAVGVDCIEVSGPDETKTLVKSFLQE